MFKENTPKISLNRLVISHYCGSGRIVAVSENYYTVKWSYGKQEESYFGINDSVSFDFYNDTEDNFYWYDGGYKDGYLDAVIGRPMLETALTSNLEGYAEGYKKGYSQKQFEKLQ